MEKHTKAPWEFDEERGLNYKPTLSGTFEISNKEGYLVASVYGIDKEQAEINANLIASAPELLEALKYLVDNTSLSKLNIKRDFSLINAHANALKAIAKAEGRS